MKVGENKSATTKTSDAGKVRLGDMSPAITTRQADPKTSDSGKVRIGGMAPAF